ncbi:hypothetical protein J1N35_036626 [Gossypium stocksii]|uniref:Uncharacterized protein n=1 Tax=Gossypium stocksii TaxID=47602 RepID=A0A9D3ZKZ7_9ROSI|nr:hypothetical protein J1N35_036626 [Gossypium stocksii]
MIYGNRLFETPILIQDRKESSASPKRETIQEAEVNVILLTSGSDNPKLGTKALTRIVREVQKGVFEVRMRRLVRCSRLGA